jgi:hypothetical protein
MPMKLELSAPAMRGGREKRTARSAWRRGVGMLRSARACSTFCPEPRTGPSVDLHIVCLWSALGLALTGLLFALGMGGGIGQMLAMAG